MYFTIGIGDLCFLFLFIYFLSLFLCILQLDICIQLVKYRNSGPATVDDFIFDYKYQSNRTILYTYSAAYIN
jgi:hypothetical protein